jgi:capsule polysaccharide export protein KpsE/RkpR
MQEYTQSNYYFIKLIIKWRIHFIIITVAAIIVGVVFSGEFFIPSKYKSFAIIYPSNLTPYSQESPAEQMMQLLESADIRNAVTRKFNLAKQYNIDTTSKLGIESLISSYESNVSISRTQFESIEISVMDTDPQLACDMVKEIINALNLKVRSLQRDKTKEVLVLLTNQMNFKMHQLDSINAKLLELRVKYQILDYKTQAKEVIKGYVKELGSGKGNIKSIDEMMRNLEEKGGEYYEYIKIYDELLKGYSVVKLSYDEAWKDMNKELTYTNMVTYPTPSYKKAYPLRSLIVILSVVSTDLFLFLVIVIIDSKRKILQ